MRSSSSFEPYLVEPSLLRSLALVVFAFMGELLSRASLSTRFSKLREGCKMIPLRRRYTMFLVADLYLCIF